MTVSYDGTHFCGWQRQKNGRSVQETLEGAAKEIFGCPVKITGSGRTDAGVHARGQVCHFDAETNIPAERLRECFNGLLPADLRVLQSTMCDITFDCTRGARKKTYCYSAYYAACELPLSERYAVRLKELPDVKKMRAAAQLLVGEHDFKAFCASGSSAKTSVRTIYSLDIQEKKTEQCTQFEIAVCGNGFLYNMVRILAGELFAIGCGKRTGGLQRALTTGERKLLGKTMPAKGLTLDHVEYDASPFAAPKEK